MRRAAILLASLTFGCGTYGITYRSPSLAAPPEKSFEVVKHHAHGVGPFIVGGGGFFFLFQSMSPALVDYTGEVDTRKICPDGKGGIAEVHHYHNYGQNSLAALISWAAIGNWFHQSNVIYKCVAPPAAAPAEATPES
jgi:hypothetical protein